MIRLDSELVMRRLAPGRERAKEYIKSGKVSVNGVVQLKPSFEVLEDDNNLHSGRKICRQGRLEAGKGDEIL